MIAITSRQLITDAGKTPVKRGIVLVEGDRIIAAGSPETVAIPQGCQILDQSGETVMPGMIDSHIHITGNSTSRVPLMDQYSSDTATAVLRGSMNLLKDLAAGVTSARSLGDIGDVELRFRQCIERGEIPGPRLVIAIRALRSSYGTARFLAVAADGVEELRKMIRQNFAMGADVVKLIVTNVMNGAGEEEYRRGDLTEVPAYSRDELVEAIGTAHELGMKAAGHAIGGPAMRWAMEAGIDSIEHANLIDERDIECFLKHGTVLSDPNLRLFFDSTMGFESRESWRIDWWRERVLRAREHSARYVPRAVQAGVKLALGVDSAHGFLWKEAECLVRIGVSQEHALAAVTRNSAELLGLADRVGTLEPGKLADIISVDGDPLQDITVLKDVRLVMKGGRIRAPLSIEPRIR
jgi:imidazolonepropionase-like amidohydrolase